MTDQCDSTNTVAAETPQERLERLYSWVGCAAIEYGGIGPEIGIHAAKGPEGPEVLGFTDVIWLIQVAKAVIEASEPMSAITSALEG